MLSCDVSGRTGIQYVLLKSLEMPRIVHRPWRRIALAGYGGGAQAALTMGGCVDVR